MAIGDTLSEALKKLVSQYAVDIEIENTDNVEDLIKAIIKANGNLKESTSNGDLEMVGKDVKKLQELIDKLDKVVEDKKKESENNITNTEINEVNVIE